MVGVMVGVEPASIASGTPPVFGMGVEVGAVYSARRASASFSLAPG